MSVAELPPAPHQPHIDPLMAAALLVASEGGPAMPRLEVPEETDHLAFLSDARNRSSDIRSPGAQSSRRAPTFDIAKQPMSIEPEGVTQQGRMTTVKRVGSYIKGHLRIDPVIKPYSKAHTDHRIENGIVYAAYKPKLEKTRTPLIHPRRTLVPKQPGKSYREHAKSFRDIKHETPLTKRLEHEIPEPNSNMINLRPTEKQGGLLVRLSDVIRRDGRNGAIRRHPSSRRKAS